MQFGAQISNYGTTWNDVLATVKTLEAGRWNSCGFDHFCRPPIRPGATETRWKAGPWSPQQRQ